MKNLINRIVAFAFIVIAISCSDNTLDPLQFDFVKKGSILALRGDQLQNIYFSGKPGAEFFPRQITGSEKFDFDAEFLAEDPSTLASFDVYVIKRTPNPDNTVTLERVFLKNVAFSEFKTSSDYDRPWVSVSINLTTILGALGLDYTNPADVDKILDVYKFGVTIESDLNLTDGSVVSANDIVAAGLFQSNQFYPAQRLTYTVTDYCSYDNSTWAGAYVATENSEFYGSYCGTSAQCAAGGYPVIMVQDLSDPDKFNLDNWYDSGIPIYIKFQASTSVATQIVTAPKQNHPTVTTRTIEGTGTYDQCKNEVTITFNYKDGSGAILDTFIWTLKKQ